MTVLVYKRLSIWLGSATMLVLLLLLATRRAVHHPQVVGPLRADEVRQIQRLDSRWRWEALRSAVIKLDAPRVWTLGKRVSSLKISQIRGIAEPLGEVNHVFIHLTNRWDESERSFYEIGRGSNGWTVLTHVRQY